GDDVELHTGDSLVLTADAIEGNAARVSTRIPERAQWVAAGDDVFLADGAIVLRVAALEGPDVVCDVVRGGTLRSRKGMHVPRAEAHVEPFTHLDAAALKMSIGLKADFV